jgi:hypothetical protein
VSDALVDLAAALGRDTTVLKLLREFQDNAAVNYPGPQRVAGVAFMKLRELLPTNEQRALSTARSHATNVHEGRSEVDYVCKKIRERIWKEMLL